MSPWFQLYFDDDDDDVGVNVNINGQCQWRVLKFMHDHKFQKCHDRKCVHTVLQIKTKTSQELRMLSSVTINCQITKIVMNSGSQLQNCNQCLKCHKSPGLSFQLSKLHKQLSV